MRWIVLFFALLLFPGIVRGGEVYQWVDNQGVIHFTDNPEAVPEAYRVKAESRAMPEEQPVVGPSESFDEDERVLIEDDLKEKDESWWRDRAEKWRQRLQAGYDEYEKVRLRYNALVADFNAAKDPEKRKELKTELDEMQGKMEEVRARIGRARKMIEEVLPSQAEKAGKPVEWVR